MWDDIPEGATIVSAPSQYDDLPQGAAIVSVPQQARQYDDLPGGASIISVPELGGLDLHLGGALSGKGSAFIEAGNRHGVDPNLLAAISVFETGNGNSRFARELNNVGGMMDPRSVNSTRGMAFPSIDDGIDAMASNLRRNYLDKGLTTIPEIQRKYSPVGAVNDVHGTNNEWASSVSRIYNKLSGRQPSEQPQEDRIDVPELDQKQPQYDDLPEGATVVSSPEAPAKRDVGAIESAYRGAKSSTLGLSETIARHGIAPFVHGVRQAIEAVEPDSPLSKFAQKADDSFWKRFVSDVGKQREDLAFDPNTEVRTLAGQKGKAADFAGEASEAVGSIVPDIGAAVATGGATAAPRSLVAGLGHAAGIFTLPAARNGMDAAKREERKGGSEADQFKAFVKAMLETQAMAAVPMNVESKLATIPARVASRAAQGSALGVATGEAFRQGENLLPGEKRDFDLKRAAIDALVPGILGGALGRNASRPREVAPKAPEAAKGGESAKPQTTTPDAEYFRGVSKEELELTRQTGKLQASKGIYKAKPGQTMVSPVREEAEQFAKKYGGGVIELDKSLNVLNIYEPGKGAAPETAKPVYHGPSSLASEKITAAAIRVKSSGRIFQGAAHWAAADKAIKEGALPEEGIAPLIENGFITSDGRFVGRKEGLEIAQKSKQDVGKPEEPGYLDALTLPLRERTQVTAKEVETAKPPSFVQYLRDIKDGKPVELYHGSKKKGLTELKANSSFTASRQLAEKFATKSGEVYPRKVVVPSDNPLRWTAESYLKDIEAGKITTKQAENEFLSRASEVKSAAALGIVASPKAVEGAALLQKAMQGGKKPPGKPSILPVYRGDVFRLYEGTADVLEKSGFKELGGKLREYVDNRRKHSGHLDNQFRLWGKGMSSSQIKAAESEFSKYHEAADKGDMTEASKAYQAASPKGKEAIDTWARVRTEAAGLASKAGFQIFDGKQWKPFKARQNFFPRRIKPEWRNVLRNPEKHPEQYEALKREAIAKGMVKNAAEFDKRVDKALESSGPNKIATVERARNAELPTQVYDYGFETVRNYIAAFSDAIAKTEAFGQAKGKNLAPAFNKAQELARDDYSKNYITKVEKAVNPGIDPDAWVAQLARGISTVSFLGNIRSSLRNLTSGAMFNLQHHGIREGTKSILEAGHAAKEIDNAYEKGILHSDLANMMTEDPTTAGKAVSKLTNKVLTWQGYKSVEEWTRALALMGAKGKLRTTIREANENPTSRSALNNSAYFKRLGIDPIALLDEAGEGPLTDRFLRSSVAEIQGGYGIDQTPLLLQSEAGKTIFHLQKWGTQALRHFDRNVVNPALQAIKTGRKEFVNVRDKDGNIIEAKVPGSVRPLARYILLAAAFGLGQQEAEEWIFGIPDKEASFAEILMRMDDDALDAMGMLAHKLYSASLSVGALGTLGGYAKTLEVAGFENALTPPPLQILSNSKDFITKWMDQGQITANNVRDVLSNQISGIRTTGQMLARANVFGKDFPYLEMIRKKQELTWMRSAIRRFEDDIGYKRKPFGGDIRANPMTPFYADIEEKLLIGDASGARKAIRDHFKGMGPDKEKIGMENLKKSVLGNRPIRAGGSSGEARRENFFDWAKKRLPKEDQIRIKQIDDTYRNTAIRLDLMNPKPVSLEAQMEDMRSLKLRNELLSGE